MSNADPRIAPKKQQPQTVLQSIAGGIALTAVLYGIVIYAVPDDSLVYRYCCGHPLEAFSLGLFLVGSTFLFLKAGRIPAERRALLSLMEHAHNTADAEQEQSDEQFIRFQPAADAPSTVSASLIEWGNSHSADIEGSFAAARAVDVAKYAQGSHSPGGLEAHLRYLAESASDRLHQSYGIVRTITWAIPILGFLGTVIGITLAIANVTPDQLDSSLGEVTGGLAVAFDTTALALALSMVLVFAAFLTERAEQGILNDVESFAIDQLLPLLQTSGSESHGSNELARQQQLLTAESSAMLQQLSQVWSTHLSALGQQWETVLTEHVQNLATRLQAETEATLAAHRESAEASRNAYQESLAAVVGEFTAAATTWVRDTESKLDVWHSALKESTLSSAAQTEALHECGRTILRLTESEERLARLQQQIDSNLESLRVADTIEQSVNSLTAAVHVISTRVQQDRPKRGAA